MVTLINPPQVAPFDWQQLEQMTALAPWSQINAPTRVPLGSLDQPEMMPPELKAGESAPAPAVMHWWNGKMDLPDFEAHWFNTGELTLYLVTGPRNGKPPLVLLPGQVEPWHSYLPSLDGLKDHFELTIVELRGHGYSERGEPNRYRIIDYARDTQAIIRDFIGEKAIVSGNSMGGMIAIAMGSLCPDIMLGAFIEDAPYTIVGEADWMEDEYFLQRAGFFPDQVAARAHQEGGMPTIEATRLVALSKMMSLPAQKFDKETRRRFVDDIVQKRLAPILKRMPEHLATRYEAAWEDYVETGKMRRKVDHLPLAAITMDKSALVKTDWNAPNSMARGEWMDEFDEDEALRGLTMPTLFWESDVEMVPMHTPEQRAHTLSVVSEPDRKFEHFHAKGCPHISHKDRPDVFVPKMVDFFGDSERAAFD